MTKRQKSIRQIFYGDLAKVTAADLGRKLTHSQAGELLGCSRQRIGQLIAAGILEEPLVLEDVVGHFIEHLRGLPL